MGGRAVDTQNGQKRRFDSDDVDTLACRDQEQPHGSGSKFGGRVVEFAPPGLSVRQLQRVQFAVSICLEPGPGGIVAFVRPKERLSGRRPFCSGLTNALPALRQPIEPPSEKDA
jgi:hypothetical protein